MTAPLLPPSRIVRSFLDSDYRSQTEAAKYARAAARIFALDLVAMGAPGVKINETRTDRGQVWHATGYGGRGYMGASFAVRFDVVACVGLLFGPKDDGTVHYTALNLREKIRLAWSFDVNPDALWNIGADFCGQTPALDLDFFGGDQRVGLNWHAARARDLKALEPLAGTFTEEPYVAPPPPRDPTACPYGHGPAPVWVARRGGKSWYRCPVCRATFDADGPAVGSAPSGPFALPGAPAGL